MSRNIDLSTLTPDIEIANLLGHDYAVKYCALPFRREGEHLWVALPHGTNDAATLRDLTDLTGLYIVPCFAQAEAIRFHINQLYGMENVNTIASQFLVDEHLANRADAFDNGSAVLESISAAPVVRLLDSLIETGVVNRASDIHIEPFGHQLRTRYRVDGVLLTHGFLGLSLLPNIISRLKVMAGIDIAKTRLPQDGHFSLTVSGV